MHLYAFMHRLYFRECSIWRSCLLRNYEPCHHMIYVTFLLVGVFVYLHSIRSLGNEACQQNRWSLAQLTVTGWPLRFPMPFWIKSMEKHTTEHSSNEKAGWVAGGKPFSMADWAPSFSNASRLRCFLCLDVCASGNPRFSDFPSGCWWGFPTKLALFDAQFSLVGKNSHLFTPSGWWRLMIWALCFLDVDSFVRIFEHQPATILFSDRESSKA